MARTATQGTCFSGAVTLVALLLSGCGDKVPSDFIGKWECGNAFLGPQKVTYEITGSTVKVTDAGQVTTYEVTEVRDTVAGQQAMKTFSFKFPAGSGDDVVKSIDMARVGNNLNVMNTLVLRQSGSCSKVS